MISSTELQTITTFQTRFYRQILLFSRWAAVLLSLLLLLIWLSSGISTAYSLPMRILIGAAMLGWLFVELALALLRRGRLRTSVLFYTCSTMGIMVVVAAVMRMPALFAFTASLYIVIGALLVSRYVAGAVALAAGLIAIPAAIADRQRLTEPIWLVTDQLIYWLAIIQIGTLFSILGMLVFVAVRASESMQRSAAEAQARAQEAEQAHYQQATLNERLTAEITHQQQLNQLIHDLEVPIIPLSAGLLVLPLIGILDEHRFDHIEHALLNRVAHTQAGLVLIDITGVPSVDRIIAARLVRLGQALRLLGTAAALTGVSAGAAQALVTLTTDLSGLRSYATIADALERERNLL